MLVDGCTRKNTQLEFFEALERTTRLLHMAYTIQNQRHAHVRDLPAHWNPESSHVSHSEVSIYTAQPEMTYQKQMGGQPELWQVCFVSLGFVHWRAAYI